MRYRQIEISDNGNPGILIAAGSTGCRRSRRWLARVLLCLLAAQPAFHASAQEGSWQVLDDMMTPRRLLAAAFFGGKVYTFGGCGSPCFDPTLHPSTFEETRVEVFDPVSGAWSTRAPMPTIFFSGAAAALGSHIYLAGGSVTGNVLQRYHPASESWTLMAPMPSSRFGLALVAFDGKLYALGGSGPSGALEVYDPGSGTWSTRAPMPTPRVFLAAAAVGGRIYAVGGSPDCCGGSQTAVLEIYNPQANAWTTGPPMPVAQQVSAVAGLDGKIHVFGGFIPGAGARDNVFEYDPAPGNWRTVAPMPTARDQAPAANDGCSAYVPGGSIDCHCQALNAFERFSATGGQVDLAITQIGRVDGDCEDADIIYSTTVRNLGPDPVAGARVRVDFPDVLGLPNLDELVDLAPGQSATFEVSSTAGGHSGASLCSTATVEAPACVNDVNSSNNSRTDCVSLSTTADLAITKSNGVDQVAGCTEEEVTYTITVENLGPCPVSGARVFDAFPPELSLPILDERIDLGPGDATVFEVTGILDPAARGSVTNTATVVAPAEIEDPDLSNNSATDSDPIIEFADLEILKSDGGVDDVYLCEEVTYTLTARNNGPCPVGGTAEVDKALVRDLFPPVFEPPIPDLVSAIDLDVETSEVFVVSGVLDASASGTLINTATIEAPLAIADRYPANNSATAVAETHIRTGDPRITKACTPAEVFLLTDVTCTLTVSNAGPDDAFGIAVTDDFPGDSIIDATWTCTPAGGATCTASGAGNIEDLVDLPAGGFATYTAVGTVEPWAREEICNTACIGVPTPECFDDTESANNCATACVDVLPDCNENHTDDAIDIAIGTSEDINTDGIPDECQVGHADWTFSGLAEGGTVVIAFEGVPGLFSDCVIVIPTVAGESPATVAANNLATLDADLCLAPQALTGMVMGATVWLEGFLLSQRRVSIEVTDPGLDYDVPAVKIPTLSAWGLVLMTVVLFAVGTRFIRRRLGS